MIKSLTQLGKDYGITDPYENYGKLAIATLEAAKKHTEFTWNEWIKPEDITILPQFVSILKDSETNLADLVFEAEPYLKLSPNDIRARTDLIVETMAQFLDQYARGELVLRKFTYQWIDFAWEDIAGSVPSAFFLRVDSQARVGGFDPDGRADNCGARSAARGLVSEPYSSDSLPLTLQINGYTYRRDV